MLRPALTSGLCDAQHGRANVATCTDGKIDETVGLRVRQSPFGAAAVPSASS